MTGECAFQAGCREFESRPPLPGHSPNNPRIYAKYASIPRTGRASVAGTISIWCTKWCTNPLKTGRNDPVVDASMYLQRYEKVCELCAKTYTCNPRKRKRQKTCSKECARELSRMRMSITKRRASSLAQPKQTEGLAPWFNHGYEANPFD